jgi:hypothetical protein
VLCHFVSTSYTDKFLKHLVTKKASALTNKTYSGEKPHTAPRGGSYNVAWVNSVNNISNPGSYNKLACYWEGHCLQNGHTAKNKLQTVTGKIPKILVQQLQIHLCFAV